ncbi:hypothetical protein MRX96_036738 [Rhipicephalus microplus]
MCQKENQPIDDFIAVLQHQVLDTGSDVKILPDQLVLNWNPPPTVKATNAKVTSYLAFSLRLTTNLLSVFSLKTSTRSHPVYNAYYFDFNATA